MKSSCQGRAQKPLNTKRKYYAKRPKKAAGSFQMPSQFQNNNSNYLQEGHFNNFKCFQGCSKWLMKLSISSPEQSQMLSIKKLPGKIFKFFQRNEFPELTNLPEDLSPFFPIDMKENQRFALVKNQPKIPLNLDFELQKDDPFGLVDKEFTNYTFEIELNAKLHNSNYTNSYKIFKDDISFKTKGFDIFKAIQSRINSLNVKDTINHIKNDKNGFSNFYTIVFDNVQCSFGVAFRISNSSLLKYFNSPYQTQFYLTTFGITIVKLKVVYSLPLIVFSHKEAPAHTPPPAPTQTQTQTQTPSSSNVTHCNFCNWHSFMSCTTPVIHEKENLTVKEILDAIIKPSLFGVGCMFKFDNHNYTKVNYFPTLNSLQINITDQNNSNFNYDSSTLDGSTMTTLSSVNEDKNLAYCGPRQIKFKEQMSKIYFARSYLQQYKDLVKVYPEIEELTLGEISKDSFFSLLWSPAKTPQPKLEKNNEFNMNFVESNNFSTFEVFYQLKSEVIRGTGHYLNVIGIFQKNEKGNHVDSSNIPPFDYFWFSNKSNGATQIRYDMDLLKNRKHYYSTKDAASVLPS